MYPTMRDEFVSSLRMRLRVRRMLAMSYRRLGAGWSWGDSGSRALPAAETETAWAGVARRRQRKRWVRRPRAEGRWRDFGEPSGESRCLAMPSSMEGMALREFQEKTPLRCLVKTPSTVSTFMMSYSRRRSSCSWCARRSSDTSSLSRQGEQCSSTRLHSALSEFFFRE